MTSGMGSQQEFEKVPLLVESTQNRLLFKNYFKNYSTNRLFLPYLYMFFHHIEFQDSCAHGNNTFVDFFTRNRNDVHGHETHEKNVWPTLSHVAFWTKDQQYDYSWG